MGISHVLFEEHNSASKTKEDATQHSVNAHVPGGKGINKEDGDKKHGSSKQQMKPDTKHKAEEAKPVQGKESEETEENEAEDHKNDRNEVEDKVTKEERKDSAVEGENDETDKQQKKPFGVKKVMGRQGQDNVRGFKLAKEPACADDVKQLCSSIPKENNFAILVCLQDSAAVSYKAIKFFVYLITPKFCHIFVHILIACLVLYYFLSLYHLGFFLQISQFFLDI